MTTSPESNDRLDLSIAERLVLLARVGSRTGRAPLKLRYGALAAVVLDLEQTGRLRMASGQVSLLDRTATGDALQDAVLESLARRGRTGRLARLLAALDRELPRLADALTHRLEGRHMLTRSQARWLGVIPWTRYEADGPTYERLLQRLREVALGARPADPVAASVISLAVACGVIGRLLDRRERRAHAGGVAVIRDTAAGAVSEAVRAVQEADSAAAVAGIVASSGGQG